MKAAHDHRVAMLADLLLDFISDPFTEASDISEAIIGELEEIHRYHQVQADKAAKVISFLGG
jgi:hypothetical protein|tara:strand:- start:3393 stop:3578 length:186 start_codon:yes stop_codon:yes gene_type:complete